MAIFIRVHVNISLKGKVKRIGAVILPRKSASRRPAGAAAKAAICFSSRGLKDYAIPPWIIRRRFKNPFAMLSRFLPAADFAPAVWAFVVYPGHPFYDDHVRPYT